MGNNIVTLELSSMVSSEKVFKFPDGKGGNIYKIQGSDGQWHDCDESGHLLDKVIEKEQSRNGERDRVTAGGPRACNVSMSVKIPPEIADTIEDYMGWLHRKYRKPVSRSGLFAKAIVEHIRKDKDYQKQIGQL